MDMSVQPKGISPSAGLSQVELANFVLSDNGSHVVN